MTLKLGEIRRLRDELAKLREHNNLNRALWVQLAGLYQRLAKQSNQEQVR